MGRWLLLPLFAIPLLQAGDAYVADHLFRKRDPRFADADKYKPARPQPKQFRTTDFDFDPDQLTCRCPAGKPLSRNGNKVTINGRQGFKFNAPKSACQDCALRARCLRNADQVTPRQVVFFDHSQPTTPTTYSARMKAKIDSDRGRMIYAGRLGTVEPVFGNLRSNKGMNRFTMRGRRKNESQFRLYALVHNIEKLAHYAGDRW